MRSYFRRAHWWKRPACWVKRGHMLEKQCLIIVYSIDGYVLGKRECARCNHPTYVCGVDCG